MCIRKSGSSRRRAASALRTEHSSVRELHPWNPSQFCSPSGASNHCFQFYYALPHKQNEFGKSLGDKIVPARKRVFQSFSPSRRKGPVAQERRSRAEEGDSFPSAPLLPCSPGDDTSGVL